MIAAADYRIQTKDQSKPAPPLQAGGNYPGYTEDINSSVQEVTCGSLLDRCCCSSLIAREEVH